MFKTFGKQSAICILSLLLLSTSLFTNLGTIKAKASQSVNNREIEELKVVYDEYNHRYAIHVGDRIGTLLIKVVRPKMEWDIEWLNISLMAKKGSYVSNINMGLYFNKEDKSNFGDIIFFGEEDYNFADRGNFNNKGSSESISWQGIQKFSGYEYPNYYVGNATYIPEKFNRDGIYYFDGARPFVVDGSQVKAYFYKNRYLVPEAIDRVKTGGIFPLINKVYWGKSELKIGEIGRATVQKQTTLWKRQNDGSLENARTLNPNEQYRVYSYLNDKGGLYGVGGGMYIKKNPLIVKYETPSRENLRLINILRGE